MERPEPFFLQVDAKISILPLPVRLPRQGQTASEETDPRPAAARRHIVQIAQMEFAVQELELRRHDVAALGFDLLAAQAVLRLRDRFPDARLILALPCPSQADRWAQTDRQLYNRMLSRADQVILVSPAYFEGCMQKRNRFMVDRSSLCVCYMKHCRGGTWYTVSYAYDQGLEIRNLTV